MHKLDMFITDKIKKYLIELLNGGLIASTILGGVVSLVAMLSLAFSGLMFGVAMMGIAGALCLSILGIIFGVLLFGAAIIEMSLVVAAVIFVWKWVLLVGLVGGFIYGICKNFTTKRPAHA